MHTNICKYHKNYNKKYIGYKSFFKYNGKETNWKIYIGSKNKELLEDFKKLGWEGFKRDYLFVGDIKTVRKMEIYYHNLYNVSANTKFYNKANQTNTKFSTSGIQISKEEKNIRSKIMKGYKHIYNTQTLEEKFVSPEYNIDNIVWKKGRPSNKKRFWIYNKITNEEKFVTKKNFIKDDNWIFGRNPSIKSVICDNISKGCKKPKSDKAKINMSLSHYNNKKFKVLNVKDNKIIEFYSLTDCRKKLNLSIHFVQLLYRGETIGDYIRIL
jgi:hypothetical protein